MSRQFFYLVFQHILGMLPSVWSVGSRANQLQDARLWYNQSGKGESTRFHLQKYTVLQATISPWLWLGYAISLSYPLLISLSIHFKYNCVHWVKESPEIEDDDLGHRVYDDFDNALLLNFTLCAWDLVNLFLKYLYIFTFLL